MSSIKEFTSEPAGNCPLKTSELKLSWGHGAGVCSDVLGQLVQSESQCPGSVHRSNGHGSYLFHPINLLSTVTATCPATTAIILKSTLTHRKS